MPQTPRLIRGTVADNIRFFRDGITDEQVEAAARLAHLHDDVGGFPGGLRAATLGGGGGQLSGGRAATTVHRPRHSSSHPMC